MSSKHIPPTQPLRSGVPSRADKLLRSGRLVLAGAGVLCCVLCLLYFFSPLTLAAQDLPALNTTTDAPTGTSTVSLGFTQPPAPEEKTSSANPAPLTEATSPPPPLSQDTAADTLSQSQTPSPLTQEQSPAPRTEETSPAPLTAQQSPAPLAVVEQRLPPLPGEDERPPTDTSPDATPDAKPNTTPGMPPRAASAAAAKAPAKGNKRLFGTIEMRASIKELRQWQDVQQRHKNNPIFVPGFKLNTSTTWDKLKSMLQDKPALEKIRGVNSFWNQWPYKLDTAVYRKEDYWAAPYEFRKNSGDCEDYAIAKYFTLKELGFSVEQMRIVVLKDTILNVAHAILAVYLDDDIYILDNIAKNVLSHTRIRNYLPVYSVNEQYRWVHMRTKAE